MPTALFVVRISDRLLTVYY